MAKGKSGKSKGGNVKRSKEVYFGSGQHAGVNSGNTRMGGHPVPIPGGGRGGK